MSNRKRRTPVSELQLGGGSYTPFEAIGQSELSRSPAAFDFSELDKRYPIQGVRPIIPSYVQEQIDEERVLRKSQELEMRRREAQLNIYDSQLNQERAMYEQIPMARQALAELNPADDDFLNQLIAQQTSNPLAYENPDFQKTVVDPLIRRHEMLQQNKLIMQRGAKPQAEEQVMTPKDYQESIVRRNALLGKKTLEELQAEDPDTAFAIEELNRMIFQYQQQNVPRGGFGGMQQPAPIGTPTPSGTPIPSTAPTQQAGGFSALRSFIGE